MALSGPVIIVEDDQNDAAVITTAIKEIGISNKIRIMHNALEAYDYLCTTLEQPFVILCDIRMPGMNGLEFRKSIVSDEVLCKKSIPFIFFTAAVSEEIVNEAYEMNVQGFYQKAKTYEGIKNQLLSILMYWKQCLHPNGEFSKVA